MSSFSCCCSFCSSFTSTYSPVYFCRSCPAIFRRCSTSSCRFWKVHSWASNSSSCSFRLMMNSWCFLSCSSSFSLYSLYSCFWLSSAPPPSMALSFIPLISSSSRSRSFFSLSSSCSISCCFYCCSRFTFWMACWLLVNCSIYFSSPPSLAFFSEGSLATGPFPSSISLSRLISSAYSLSMASFGSSLTVGLFLMFLALAAYLSVP